MLQKSNSSNDDEDDDDDDDVDIGVTGLKSSQKWTLSCETWLRKSVSLLMRKFDCDDDGRIRL